MEFNLEQFASIEPYLPRQRGNVSLRNLDIINAILWLAENDCKWSALPNRFGSWHTVYVRVNRWSMAGVLDRVFEQMQRLGLIRLQLEVNNVRSATSSSVAVERFREQARRAPSMDLSSELPQFAWVPRIRVCHRRLAAARRRSAKTQAANPTVAPDAVASIAG